MDFRARGGKFPGLHCCSAKARSRHVEKMTIFPTYMKLTGNLLTEVSVVKPWSNDRTLLHPTLFNGLPSYVGRTFFLEKI